MSKKTHSAKQTEVADQTNEQKLKFVNTGLFILSERLVISDPGIRLGEYQLELLENFGEPFSYALCDHFREVLSTNTFQLRRF